MLARLRSLLATWLIKTPVRIVLGVFAAYLLFAWFAFEPLVKWAAPKFIADKSQHQLSIAAARFDPFALSLSIKGLKLSEPKGQPLLAFDELFVDFDATSLLRWAYSFDVIRLTGPQARVELLPGARLNWSGLLDAFKSTDDEPAKPLPRLLIRRIALERGQVDLADRVVGFETRFDPLNFSLSELSTLPDDKGAYSLAATTELGARIRWKGDIELKPVVATGELSVDQVSLARLWPYVQGRLNMVPPEGVAALALSYRLGWANKQLTLTLDKLGASLEKLALRGKADPAPVIALDRFALSGGRFDLAKRSLEIGEIALTGGRIDLARDRDGQLTLQDWFNVPGAKPPVVVEASKSGAKAPPSRPSFEAEPWRIKLARFQLDGLGVRLRDATFATPLNAEIGNLQIAFNAQAEVGAGTPRATLDGLAVKLSQLRLGSAASKDALFTLAGIQVTHGKADLTSRTASIGQVLLSDGRLAAERDAQGRIGLIEAFKPAAATAAKSKPAATPAAEAGEPWHWQVGEIGLTGFQVSAVDRSVQPAGELTLQAINASARGLSDNLKAAIPVKLGFKVKEGGQFEASGKVVPAKPSAEVQLRLSDLALAPVQPYLAQTANLTLASGRASLAGRLKYTGKPAFSGGFSVDDLLLNESEGGARFLAWKRLSSEGMEATDQSVMLDELRLDSLGAKLVIYQDKSVNLKKILKSPGAGGEGKAATSQNLPTPALPASGEGANQPPAFRFAIDRIRVENGELDFADHSLALPFGTRIHHFKGAFNGIANQPGSHAQLELDGQVDDYGLARFVGQLDLFNPTDFMDIKTVFRNVEMANLTPYSATFAGRKIASGKLSLDLEYRIKQRQLLGENQVILDKLTLGERVQSPTAKDLPLDLAIAILQDSDGKIDLGLPVSGSLDDPQFSYGAIVWKAITNVLTKIVTAPFRALASLFGGNAEKLEKIAFEAGEAGLTPPEREKFKQIATVLNKRPGLALTVHGAWNPVVDRPVLKEQQLRRAVVEKMGVKLAADEEPGPISTAHAKTQSALEQLYAARMGDKTWNELAAKWRQANPDKKPEGGAGQLMSRLKGLFKKDEPLSAEDLAQFKGADLHAMLYRQLLDKESVSDETLKALAGRRAQAVVDGLGGAGAPLARIKAEGIETLTGEGREVLARLELGVAKK